MTPLRRLRTLAALAAFSGTCFLAATALRAAPPPGQTDAGTASVAAPPGPTRVCVDAQTTDPLTEQFAGNLRAAIAESHALSVASTTDSCDLQLHVPGNLLRFETAGGIMVSAVVIVTSASGRYLSSSITACQANDLKPCAARAVAVAKLALLMTSSNGS